MVKTFNVTYFSNSYLLLSLLFGISLVGVLGCAQLYFVWAFVIVVAESEWGFKALRLSANLVKETNWDSKRLVLSYLLSAWHSCLGLWLLPWMVIRDVIGWFELIIVVLVCMHCTYNIMTLLIIGNTVLYVYCKDLVSGVSGKGYVSLPSDVDGEKVPQVVAVEYAC